MTDAGASAPLVLPTGILSQFEYVMPPSTVVESLSATTHDVPSKYCNVTVRLSGITSLP